MSNQNSTSIVIGKNDNCQIELNLALANRHGLIAGATGTGKSVTLQKLAQSFSDAGVPVFLSDIKGDLSGVAALGVENSKVKARIEQLKILNFKFSKNPTIMWDVFGKFGHPLRATLSDLGPIMLARLLELNETQSDVLQIVFKIADDRKLELIDSKDLQSLLRFISENANDLKSEYGLIASTSLGAIQRSVIALSQQGADQFLGEPMFDCHDLTTLDSNGKGYIHLLNATELILNPKLYSLFLLWLLSELFENLPEVGDLEKPKLVFFFDEAHLLFKETPKALIEKIENVVRLIRSKGVGIYFVTQNPLDVPESILGQLGNRYQHALRAFTPKDQKAVKVAAQTMRPNPDFDTAEVITLLGVGEALVSVLDAAGTPCVTQRVFIIPPTSKIGPISPEDRTHLISNSRFIGKYENKIDRVTAFESLSAQSQKEKSEEKAEPAPKAGRTKIKVEKPTATERIVQSAARTVANEVGRQIVRGILGGIFGSRR